MTTQSQPVLLIDGGQPLAGSITLAGAKNAATKILLATLLSDEPSTITNVPQLGDIEITAELLRHVGAKVESHGSVWTISTPTIDDPHIPPLSRQNRIPVLAIGPLLHRTREVTVPVVGGDAIGARPVDYHLAALRMMGATIDVDEQSVRARATRLRGAQIQLPYPSVGATENIILAAVLAEGRTVLQNGAIEPEVLDLVQMLQTMGAIIELGSGRTYTIDGVERLHGTTYAIMPDRNEAVSFASAALATGGEIMVRGARQDHLLSWLNTVRRIGGAYAVLPEGIRFWRPGPLRGIDVETDTHPGFMTDWQQPLVTVLTQAEGESRVHETVYEDRFGYTQSLRQMGANIETSTDCFGSLPCRWWAKGLTHSCRILGPSQLQAATVDIPDIRAGMAQLIAALTAQGQSTITGVGHLDRGYQALDDRFREIGARIQRQPRVY